MKHQHKNGMTYFQAMKINKYYRLPELDVLFLTWVAHA